MILCTISKEIEFDAAHRVPYHESKCKHVHGHRYRVVAFCSGPVIPDDEVRPDAGMVVDFGDIKAALTEEIHDVFDHRTIVWIKDDKMRAALLDYFPESVRCIDTIPTAENLAVEFHRRLNARLRGDGFALLAVEVWETPTSMARYEP